MTDPAAGLRTAEGWVWKGNVRPFLEMLSDVVGYGFDDSDRLAVSGALPGTDDERSEDWYCYPLVGRSEVQVRVAQAVGGSVVSVEIGYAADDRLAVAVPLLLDVFARYQVLPEGGRL